jgi:hypothetical protein
MWNFEEPDFIGIQHTLSGSTLWEHNFLSCHIPRPVNYIGVNYNVTWPKKLLPLVQEEFYFFLDLSKI